MGRKELVRLGWAWSNFLSSKSHQSLQAELRRRKGEDKGDAPLRACSQDGSAASCGGDACSSGSSSGGGGSLRRAAWSMSVAGGSSINGSVGDGSSAPGSVCGSAVAGGSSISSASQGTSSSALPRGRAAACGSQGGGTAGLSGASASSAPVPGTAMPPTASSGAASAPVRLATSTASVSDDGGGDSRPRGAGPRRAQQSPGGARTPRFDLWLCCERGQRARQSNHVAQASRSSVYRGAHRRLNAPCIRSTQSLVRYTSVSFIDGVFDFVR